MVSLSLSLTGCMHAYINHAAPKKKKHRQHHKKMFTHGKKIGFADGREIQPRPTTTYTYIYIPREGEIDSDVRFVPIPPPYKE